MNAALALHPLVQISPPFIHLPVPAACPSLLQHICLCPSIKLSHRRLSAGPAPSLSARPSPPRLPHALKIFIDVLNTLSVSLTHTTYLQRCLLARCSPAPAGSHARTRSHTAEGPFLIHIYIVIVSIIYNPQKILDVKINNKYIYNTC